MTRRRRTQGGRARPARRRRAGLARRVDRGRRGAPGRRPRHARRRLAPARADLRRRPRASWPASSSTPPRSGRSASRRSCSPSPATATGRFGEATTRSSAHPLLIAVALATVGLTLGSAVLHFMLGVDHPGVAALPRPSCCRPWRFNLLLAYPVYGLCARLLPPRLRRPPGGEPGCLARQRPGPPAGLPAARPAGRGAVPLQPADGAARRHPRRPRAWSSSARSSSASGRCR